VKVETVVNGRPAVLEAKDPYKHERMIVAIDPDSDAPGVALIHDGQIRELESLDFFDIQDRLQMSYWAGALFVIEDIDNKNPTYARNGVNAKQQGVINAISRKVGRAQNSARQLITLLERVGVEYVLVEPLRTYEKQRSKKGGEGSVFFKALTGWPKRTNEDQRDAAILGLYGLQQDYQVCDKRHVYVGNFCQVCAREQRRKDVRAARKKANALMKQREAETAAAST